MKKNFFILLTLIPQFLFCQLQQQTIQHIIEGLKCSPEVTLEPLSGGLTNLSYKLSCSDNLYFVRFIPKDNSYLGLSLEKEYACTKLASEIGLAPQVRVFSLEDRIFVTDFVRTSGKKIDLDDSATLAKICALIKKLHQSNVVFPTAITPLESIERYLNILESHHITIPEAYNNLARAVIEYTKAMPFRNNDTLVPCHLDLFSLNLLDDGTKIWLTDWEYAAMSDPLFDLSTLASADGLDRQHMYELLSIYLGDKVTEEEMANFLMMKALADIRWGLWSFIQMHLSELDADFQFYADIFFKQAIYTISILRAS